MSERNIDLPLMLEAIADTLLEDRPDAVASATYIRSAADQLRLTQAERGREDEEAIANKGVTRPMVEYRAELRQKRENEIIEECAKVADELARFLKLSKVTGNEAELAACLAIAENIRALKRSGQESGEMKDG